MALGLDWQKEVGPRVQGARALDSAKVQAPCIVRRPDGGFRLFYTAVGPGKPFANCQGYILSAVSQDGLAFSAEAGIRLGPNPSVSHLSLRALVPSIATCGDGAWRMYYEARGPAKHPPRICSAISKDMLHWEPEEGTRLELPDGVGGPRYLALPQGGGRLYCCGRDRGRGADEPKGVISAFSADGLNFELEPGYRIQAGREPWDMGGITAAEVVPPQGEGGRWSMVYSAWEDVPPETVVPLHPSHDPAAETNGSSLDFAAASIASDMAGFRSRIFVAYSRDGLKWQRAGCILAGQGYGGEGLDAVHAEDMSLVELDSGGYRMYYAACDKEGNWRIASAVMV